jgi:DNA-binding CsgD family transcriptional regulator
MLWGRLSCHRRSAMALDLEIRDRLRLTGREWDIFNLLVAGVSCREMARTLQISENTVRKFRGRIFRKLNIRSAAGAVSLITTFDEKPPLVTPGWACSRLANCKSPLSLQEA